MFNVHIQSKGFLCPGQENTTIDKIPNYTFYIICYTGGAQHLFVCLFVYLFVCLFNYLSIYLSIFFSSF